MEIIEEKVDRRYEMNDCLDTNRLSNLLSHLLYQRARDRERLGDGSTGVVFLMSGRAVTFL